LIFDAASAHRSVVGSSGNVAPPSAPSIYKGDTIEMTDSINIRTGSSTGNSVIRKSTKGEKGSIVGGPVYNDGYHWY